MGGLWTWPKLLLDVRRATRGGPEAVAARRRERLARLVALARANSPFYREHYGRLPATIADPVVLPPVTKAALMERFDDWVTDRAVTRAGLDEFLADRALVGTLYRGRYAVWTSSGSTGGPGIFLHDEGARAVYRALNVGRQIGSWAPPRALRTYLRRGLRVAFVIVAGRHTASAASIERVRREYPRLARNVRVFSALSPLPELVPALNDFQPTVLCGYPTALTVLAREQAAGRLALRPAQVRSGGEWLGPPSRRAIEAAFRCPVHDAYASAELATVALGCPAGWMHVNADWIIVEPVDADLQPVPAGQASTTVLVTNLANRIQPIIRYDQGDSVTARPDPCPCGNSLPAIQVEGRRYDVLEPRSTDGAVVPLVPQAILAAVYRAEGLANAQVAQTGPTTLTIRLEADPDHDHARVLDDACHHLRAYLAAHGLPMVAVEGSPDLPRRDPVSGKVRRVLIESRERVGPA